MEEGRERLAVFLPRKGLFYDGLHSPTLPTSSCWWSRIPRMQLELPYIRRSWLSLIGRQNTKTAGKCQLHRPSADDHLAYLETSTRLFVCLNDGAKVAKLIGNSGTSRLITKTTHLPSGLVIYVQCTAC